MTTNVIVFRSKWKLRFLFVFLNNFAKKKCEHTKISLKTITNRNKNALFSRIYFLFRIFIFICLKHAGMLNGTTCAPLQWTILTEHHAYYTWNTTAIYWFNYIKFHARISYALHNRFINKMIFIMCHLRFWRTICFISFSLISFPEKANSMPSQRFIGLVLRGISYI